MQPTVLGLPPDIEQLLGRGHLLVLHFPIALLLAAFLLEMLHRFRRTGTPSPSGLTCCLLGTLGALVAGLTGWLYAEYDPPGRSLEDALFLHRWVAVGTASVATLALIFGAAARKGTRPKATAWYRVLLLLVAGGVTFVGHEGGEMANGEEFFDVLGTEPVRAGTDPGASGLTVGTTPTPAASGANTPATSVPSATSGDAPPLETPAGVSAAGSGDTPPQAAATLAAPGISGGFDFAGLVQPIFEARCIECHGPTKRKGRLRLDTPADSFKGAPGEWLVQPGKPDASELLRLVELPDDDLDRMPGKGGPLTPEQVQTLRAWIVAGAPWPGRPGADPAGATTPPAGSAADAAEAPAPPAASEDHDDGHADAPPQEPEPMVPDDAAARVVEQAAMSGLVARGALAAPVAADQRAVEVDFGLLGDQVGDDDLALLDGLQPALVWLGLQGTAVTDDGLAQLADFTALRRLNLSRTGVGDAGLAHLAGLAQLESLNLYGTAVTDAGLSSLHGLSMLKRLYLWDTAVTAAGVQALAQALPGAVVDVGVGAEALSTPETEDEGDG